jgi:hypothetical protein
VGSPHQEDISLCLSTTHSESWHWMKVDGQLHALHTTAYERDPWTGQLVEPRASVEAEVKGEMTALPRWELAIKSLY